MTNTRYAPYGDAKTNSVVSVISCVLVTVVPLALAAYWPLFSLSQGAATAMLRPLILVACLLLTALWYCLPATSAEVQAGCLLSLLVAAFLIPSLASTDPKRALLVWTKLFILCTVSLLLARALRHDQTARVFGIALILVSIAVGAFIVFTYIHFIGFVVPTYKLTREFKGVAERVNIPLNAVPFTAVFSFLAGMCLVRTNRLLCLVGLALFVISSVFTGSRTPLAILLASAFVLALLNALRSRHLAIRLSAFLTAVAILSGLPLLLWRTSFKSMSSMTEGRWDLWSVAVAKFAERPLVGFGYISWHDDLVSRLPGAYVFTSSLAKNLLGGYHNEYLSLLAEQGLVGFIPAMLFATFLFYTCWKGAFYTWNTWQAGQWPLFACLFLLLRAAVEIPGLFGEGSEPADFLAYIFVAIVISRFSREEDFLRFTASPTWDAAPAATLAASA